MDAVICAHINEVFLEDLVRLANEFPDVPIVLDHSAYLNASDLPESSRLNFVCELAQHKNIYAQVNFWRYRFGTSLSIYGYP